MSAAYWFSNLKISWTTHAIYFISQFLYLASKFQNSILIFFLQLCRTLELLQFFHFFQIVLMSFMKWGVGVVKGVHTFLRRSAQVCCGPHGSSGRSAGGSAGDEGWMRTWRSRHAHHMCGWCDMRNTLEACVQCVNHDDTNLINRQQNCAPHVSVFMCAVLKVFWVLVVTLSLVSCLVSPRRRNTKYRFLSFWILQFTFAFVVRLYSVIDNSYL